MAARRIRLSWRSSSNSTRIGFLPSALPVSMWWSLMRKLIQSEHERVYIKVTASVLVFFHRFSGADSFGQFRQAIEYSHAAQPLLIIECWNTAYHRARRYITMCAALGSDNHAITDFAMSGHPGLAGKDHILAQLC